VVDFPRYRAAIAQPDVCVVIVRRIGLVARYNRYVKVTIHRIAVKESAVARTDILGVIFIAYNGIIITQETVNIQIFAKESSAPPYARVYDLATVLLKLHAHLARVDFLLDGDIG
jgi:hypothetical protein